MGHPLFNHTDAQMGHPLFKISPVDISDDQ